MAKFSGGASVPASQSLKTTTKRSHKVIVALTAPGILDEHIAKKLV